MPNRLVATLFAVFLLTASTFGDVKYYVTDMGPFVPGAINSKGQIAGFVPPSNNAGAFLPGFLAVYDHGHLTNLGNSYAQTQFGPVNYSSLDVQDFNDRGDMVIMASTSNPLSTGPLFYINGSFSTPSGIIGNSSILRGQWGIDASGIAGGISNSSGKFAKSWSYDGTTVTTIQGYGLFAPNDNGVRVGVDGNGDPVIDQNGVITPLGTLNSFGKPATGLTFINDASELYGNSGLIYKDGALIVLPRLGTVNGATTLVDMNNNGVVVGAYISDNNNHTLAAIYDGTTFQDLNNLIDPTAGWVLTSAYALNDSGSIVGMGTHNGVAAGFLLTPVPEPVAALGLALPTYLLIRRRHRSTSAVSARPIANTN